MDKRDATRTQTWLVGFNPQNVHRPQGSALLRKHTNDWNTNHKRFMMILLQNAVKCSKKILGWVWVSLCHVSSFILLGDISYVCFISWSFHLLLLDVQSPTAQHTACWRWLTSPMPQQAVVSPRCTWRHGALLPRTMHPHPKSSPMLVFV